MLARAIFLGLALLLGIGPAAQAQEVIRSFQSDVRVHSDGTLDVVETITVNAQGDAIVHGIYRDFPRYFVKADRGRGKVAFDVTAIERDGARESWTSETISGGTRIRIGDGDKRIAPGAHVYRIEYSTDRQIRFDETYDQLVWNVTGDGWQFPIQSATATVTLPDGFRPQAVTAYTGARGATEQDATARIAGDRAVFATTRPLGVFEGLTIDVQLPKGAVSQSSGAQIHLWWWRDNLGMLIALGGLLAVFGYFLTVWRAVGRDPKSGVVVARWDPPARVSPALAGYIDESGFSDGGRTAIAASAIDLAVKGFVTLDDLDKAVTIRRTAKPASDKLPAGQAALINAVGGPGQALTIDRANGGRVEALGKRFYTAIESENRGVFFQTNKLSFFIGLLVSLGAAAAWFFISDAPREETIMVAFSSIVPLLLNLFAWKLLKARRRRVSAAGRLVYGVGVLGLALFGLAAFGVVWGTFDTMTASGHALQAMMLGWGLVLINQVFFVLNGASTPLGRDIKDHIAGLRLYLTLAEKDRMNIEGAPQMSPSHFETLLPYAVVLGVERRWSKSFETWLSTSMAGAATAYAPTWHTGKHVDFTQSIGGFASAVRSSMAASVPQSSSFGGGSSGSGGGGGGGGGW